VTPNPSSSHLVNNHLLQSSQVFSTQQNPTYNVAFSDISLTDVKFAASS